MEVGVDLDTETVEALEAEAERRGFGGVGAYLRWIVATRPASDLAEHEAPGVASRLAELEERLTAVEEGLDRGVADAAGPGVAAGGEADEEDPEATVVGDEPEDSAADDDIAAAVDEVSLEDE